MSVTADTLREPADKLEQAEKFPFGPPIDPQHMQAVGEACVRLCNEDPDKARAMWKLVVEQCGGYMPAAAAIALLRAASTVNLVPDVTAPEAW